ncbi:zinc finger BED domain-containing protein RICESLEEPER 2-like protein [Tanacetum coccineum]
MDIMNRLPVKSLLQFRTVSKQWKSYIDSSNFIRDYGFREIHTCCFNLTYKRGLEGFMCSVDEKFAFTPLNVNFNIPLSTPIATSEGSWYVSVFTVSSRRWYNLESYCLPRKSIRIKRAGQAVIGGKIFWVGSEKFYGDWNGYLRKGRKTKPKRQNRTRNGKDCERQSQIKAEKSIQVNPDKSKMCKFEEPVDGPYCQGCALLRKEFMEGLFTNCVENEFFKDFQDTSESSDDNTNVVNAPREPIVVNQDPVENSSPSPLHIDHCCHECGDSLDGIFCRQCTCKSCGKGAHYGYNCPPRVPIISNPEPCKNQTIDEPLQNLQSLQQQCLLGTCQRCGCNEYDGVCFYCKVGNGTQINVSTPYFSNDSPSVANHPPQPQYVPYSFQPPQYTVNHPIFNSQNELLNSQNKLMEQMATLRELVDQAIQKKEEEKRIAEEQAAKDRSWKIPICYDDDEDNTIAITPIVVNSDDDNSSSDDDSPYGEDIDYVDASPPDVEIVSLEVVEIVDPEVGRIDDDILLTIKDDILREKLLNVNLLIAKIDALRDNPTPSSEVVIKSTSTFPNLFLEETNTFDNSIPESKTFPFYIDNDHFKERSSAKSDFYHEEFADELAHIISPPEYDHFCFKIEPELGNLTMDVVNDIFPTREPRVHVPNVLPTHLTLDTDFILLSEPLFAYIVWIFLPFLTYPVAPPYLLSCGNEDTTFDPGISIYHSFMPDVSHRSGTFMKFNVYPNRLNESPMMILSSTCFPMNQ